MNLKIEFTSSAEKGLVRLDKPGTARIIKYLRERVSEDTSSSGKTMKRYHSGLRRYQVGDCQMICDIYDEKISVLVVRVAHRNEVYR